MGNIEERNRGRDREERRRRDQEGYKKQNKERIGKVRDERQMEIIKKYKIIIQLMNNKSIRIRQWIIEKGTDFAHFTQKTTHISRCISLHISISATVTMHICIVTVAFYILFYYFFSPLTFLSFPLTLSLQPIISTTQPSIANHT